jgi:hypothetical protein
MADYYVTHPNLNFSAIVHAPTTEKARTTFLDYLERSGQLSRSARQRLRMSMVAERVDDPFGLDADVELSYDYVSQPESLPVGDIASTGEYQEPSIEPPIPAEEPSTRSPIQEVSLNAGQGVI